MLNRAQADCPWLRQSVVMPAVSTAMPASLSREAGPESLINHIELNLRDIHQLFNTIDPSPFQEKDLDREAEDFILSWAHEFPVREPMDLIVHLQKMPEHQNAKRLITEAVHHYFAYRAQLNRLEFTRLMKLGRTSLLVGLTFLGVCLLVIQFVPRSGLVPECIRQGLTIAGWVAMWKPMDIYLYQWWPLVQRRRVFEKLSTVSVEVRKGRDPTAESIP